MSSIEMTEQTKIDTLQLFLLLGRLPADLAKHFIGRTGLPAEMAMEACMIFAGMGIVWPLPCLAKKEDGGWFDVKGAGPGDGSVWQQ